MMQTNRYLVAVAGCAAVTLLANTVCFSSLDSVGLWIGVAVVLGAGFFAGRTKRRLLQFFNVAILCFFSIASAVSFYSSFETYGTCPFCPRGIKVSTNSYWGSNLRCSSEEGMQASPRFGTGYSEGGTATHFYRESFQFQGKNMTVSASCGWNPEEVEIEAKSCVGDEGDKPCSDLTSEGKPMRYKTQSCKNLSHFVHSAERDLRLNRK